MEVVIVVLVVIGALFAIASGVWVAIALISAISGHRAEPSAPRQANEKNTARLGSDKPRQARREPKSSD